VAKAFDAIWIIGLILKVMILNFPSYLVQTISRYFRGEMFEASFQTAMPSCPLIPVWVLQGGLISPILVSLQSTACPRPHFTSNCLSTRPTRPSYPCPASQCC